MRPQRLSNTIHKNLFSIISIWVCITLLLVVGLSPVNSQAECEGKERWAVKTGTDVDASMVDLTSATPTTIAALIALPGHNPMPHNMLQRRFEPEKTVWVVDATLFVYKREG